MRFSTSMVALAATFCWSSVLAVPLHPWIPEIKYTNRVDRIDPNTLTRRGEGYWKVVNKCANTIYYTTVNQEAVFGGGQIAPGSAVTGPYGASQDGISVKMCWTPNCSQPYQFETTADRRTSPGRVSYDLSAVDGSPMLSVVNGVYTSDNSGPSFWCGVGDKSCAFDIPSHGPVGTAGISTVVTAQMC